MYHLAARATSRARRGMTVEEEGIRQGETYCARYSVPGAMRANAPNLEDVFNLVRKMQYTTLTSSRTLQFNDLYDHRCGTQVTLRCVGATQNTVSGSVAVRRQQVPSDRHSRK